MYNAANMDSMLNFYPMLICQLVSVNESIH